MAERVRSERKGKRGRKLGSMTAATRFAYKKARARGMLPAELLHDWALNGVMRKHPVGGNKFEDVYLDPKDRIDCAKACARYFSPIMQPVPAEGAKPPVYKIELDPSKLSGKSTDELQVLREILTAVQKGEAIDAALLEDDEDPSRYGDMLTESSETVGSA